MNKLLGAGLLALTVLLAGCSDDKDDTTKPTVSIPAISAVTTAGDVTVTANASDNKGIKSVAFYDNGTFVSTDTSSPYTATLNYTAANNGSHTIKAVATDKNNNTAETTQTITVNIASVTPPAADTTKPVVSDLMVNPGTISSVTPQPVTISGKATDDVTIKQVKLSLTGSIPGSTTPTTLPLPDASYDSATKTFTFTINPSALDAPSKAALGILNSVTVTAIAVDSSGNTSDPATKTLTITH